ncbi:MAG: outer membrane beta-barrel domain-containing protein [Chitinophagaceae bacterium]|nr:outer membrane beta-barrel domain-containing protein [Oligoflexus sp.]
MRLSRHFLWLVVSVFGLAQSPLLAADYKKSTEGKEVVMGKLYPKSERWELALPELGIIMNQSYVNTTLLGGGLTYWMNENLGFSFSGSIAQNSDKAERTCIESFYFDPSNEVGVACGGPGLLTNADTTQPQPDGFPKYGPAYVPIREIQQIMMFNVVYAPVYGKQLFMKSSTSYFDLFLELGVGFATSKFYPKRDVLENGNTPRGTYIDPNTNDAATAAANNAKIGATADQTDSYGIGGRPKPLSQGNPLLNLGIGQKFHFGKVFDVKVYVRNMTLLGTDQGFDNLLVLHVGLGMRF